MCCFIACYSAAAVAAASVIDFRDDCEDAIKHPIPQSINVVPIFAQNASTMNLSRNIIPRTHKAELCLEKRSMPNPNRAVMPPQLASSKLLVQVSLASRTRLGQFLQEISLASRIRNQLSRQEAPQQSLAPPSKCRSIPSSHPHSTQMTESNRGNGTSKSRCLPKRTQVAAAARRLGLAQAGQSLGRGRHRATRQAGRTSRHAGQTQQPAYIQQQTLHLQISHLRLFHRVKILEIQHVVLGAHPIVQGLTLPLGFQKR